MCCTPQVPSPLQCKFQCTLKQTAKSRRPVQNPDFCSSVQKCPHKEAAFIWSVLHGAVAVNTWRAKASPGLDLTYCCCDTSSSRISVTSFLHISGHHPCVAVCHDHTLSVSAASYRLLMMAVGQTLRGSNAFLALLYLAA